MARAKKQPAVTPVKPAASPKTAWESILASRKPVVAVQINGRKVDGTLDVEILADDRTGPRGQMLTRLQEILEDLFVAATKAKKLTDDEWAQLFAVEAPDPDCRWQLLLRLGREETDTPGKEETDDPGKVRNQFVALPDGTSFSMRLLLLDRRGRARAAAATEEEDGTVAFARLPDVVRLNALQRAMDVEAQQPQVCPTDASFAPLLTEELRKLDIRVGQLTDDDVSGFREKLNKTGAKGLFPNSRGRQQLRTKANGPTPTEG
jgi:hypothetical protein